ncbi:hypothetical protein B0J11DRAFT_442839 [Dendryphion nanum]|uniref:CRIB domain-containing protein n=1 Tax=Dendryphion nanum TaxID=256645 RepID=A0A9P9DDX8_9PLEO|nr:hypothetical protein B0J11DRAFT_442839 [Dendryphion nanum]
MFLFNKNNALPRSRQSSIDSLVTDPSGSTSTSTSEIWISQCSDASSYGEIPSPDQRERSYPGKRSSVFTLRSRSNTTTSTTSSFVSLSPSMARPDSSLRPSPMDFSVPKRTLFTRGKRGKRTSGGVSPGLEVDLVEEMDAGGKRTSVLRKGRKSNRQSAASPPHLKHRISSPFDFQHLTHTDRHQFAALEQTSETDLAANFWAVRASQQPCRDLNGIQAEDLHFSNFSSENLVLPESRSPSTMTFRSPPLSPEPPYESTLPESPHDELTRKVIRTTRSVESFSRPGINPRVHRHTQSVAAPPRTSSRMPLASIDDDVSEGQSDHQRMPPPSRPQSNRQSGVWDMFAPLSPSLFSGPLPPIADEPDYVGHAVTTPDDSAIHPFKPPFTPGLEDVAEETEKFISPRPAPHPPAKTPMSPRSPLFDSFSFRSTQRSPIVRSSSRGSSYTSPKSTNQRTTMTRPISQMSDTLGSPVQSRRQSIRRASTVRRKSNTWRVIEESWEDDVDYIYDNALEADCDFDWDCMSDDEVFEDRDKTPDRFCQTQTSVSASQDSQLGSRLSQEEVTMHNPSFSGVFRPSLLVPSTSHTPELEARSAVSASTADSSLPTPSDPFSFTQLEYRESSFPEAGSFVFSSSLLSPPDLKEQISREDAYDEILADYEGSDRHFPLLDASHSIAGSARSSQMQRSSYDSSLMSSGPMSGSWSSPIRRSASSSGSLPELVHSRRARKDFSQMVEQLSEQVASFSTLGEDDPEENEDNDTTPPGRLSQDKIFFVNDDEQQSPTYNNSVEGEVRASLELARQGSIRSAARAPIHHHKYASSDGAAKVLGSSDTQTQSRNRSASSSKAVRGNRQPYLSLFPAPPRHSPLYTPTSP